MLGQNLLDDYWLPLLGVFIEEVDYSVLLFEILNVDRESNVAASIHSLIVLISAALLFTFRLQPLRF